MFGAMTCNNFKWNVAISARSGVQKRAFKLLYPNISITNGLADTYLYISCKVPFTTYKIHWYQYFIIPWNFIGHNVSSVEFRGIFKNYMEHGVKTKFYCIPSNFSHHENILGVIDKNSSMNFHGIWQNSWKCNPNIIKKTTKRFHGSP